MTTQLLTGIPGTGKTHHLTERALRYLADGNDPARLLILAPTRTAATRMRDTIAASSDRSLSVAPTRAWYTPSTCSNEPKPAGCSAA